MSTRSRRSTVDTRVVTCGRLIKGPRIGRNVVAWTKNCNRKVRIPADWSDWDGKCFQHRSPDLAARIKAALGPKGGER
jgi:hypothetical protein